MKGPEEAVLEEETTESRTVLVAVNLFSKELNTWLLEVDAVSFHSGLKRMVNISWIRDWVEAANKCRNILGDHMPLPQIARSWRGASN